MQEKKKQKPALLFLGGDKECCERLEKTFLVQGKNITKIESESTEIVFSEGDKYSFKKIIETIQEPRKNNDYFFHASDSVSIISSSQKNSSGEAFLLHS